MLDMLDNNKKSLLIYKLNNIIDNNWDVFKECSKKSILEHSCNYEIIWYLNNKLSIIEDKEKKTVDIKFVEFDNSDFSFSIYQLDKENIGSLVDLLEDGRKEFLTEGGKSFRGNLNFSIRIYLDIKDNPDKNLSQFCGILYFIDDHDKVIYGIRVYYNDVINLISLLKEVMIDIK